MVQHNLNRARYAIGARTWYKNRAEQHQDILDSFHSINLNANLKKHFGVQAQKKVGTVKKKSDSRQFAD